MRKHTQFDSRKTAGHRAIINDGVMGGVVEALDSLIKKCQVGAFAPEAAAIEVSR